MKNKFLLIFILCLSWTAHSQEIREVRWGTEVWKGFTDEDGSGLYTQLLKKIFEYEGIRLEVKIYPFARALHLLKSGHIDIAGGIPKEREKNDIYIQSRYPIVVSRFSIFYKRGTFQYNGIESIRNKRIVCTPKVGEMIGLDEDKMHIVTTRDQAIQLVLRGRDDIYLDDEKVLFDTMEKYGDEFNMNEYQTQNIAIEGWYMIFSNSGRGRKIRNIYEEGTRRMAASGELEELYTRLGFLVPEIED